VISRFIFLNRRGATWLEARFPFIFAADSYKLELEKRIFNDLRQYQYIGLDIESRPDCYAVYDKFIVQTIEKPVDLIADMIVSITLLEHVPDNVAAIRSMYLALRPGSSMHHYIPSKWHPYSIALRLIGHDMQKRLIALLRPAAVTITGYPAFFDHCDPNAMSRLLTHNGFVDIDIKAFYRASDYFAFFLPAYLMVALFENLCSALNMSFFASGFVLSARRPGAQL
jgi:SAM-dependent methyltransferase